MNKENADLVAEKLSVPVMVPTDFLRDCHVNLWEFFANPAAFRREPVVLTRRQKFLKWVSGKRLVAGGFLYRVVTGHEVPEERDWYDD